MQTTFLTDKPMPYCPGCGHTVANNSIAKALEKLSLHPLDVVIVSDIGCCGLIDPLFNCHTIHGLHGRVAALAMGVAMGLHVENPEHNKKIIAIQGDGGATIGLQHLLEASRQNVDMTLIVANNMVYGMTGGQISGLSTNEFKSYRMPEEQDIPPFDICTLAHHAGAAYVSRITAKGDISEQLAEAFSVKGFSLVEIDTLCPSYALKKIKDFTLSAHQEMKLTQERKLHKVHVRETKSLFEALPSMGTTNKELPASIKTKKVIIAGSAGEGVQSAADLLALAGIHYGLHTTKKGEYPITVGTGYSVAEVILSPNKINYTGIEIPDVVIISSEEGLEKVRHSIAPSTQVVVDSSLASVVKHDWAENFRTVSGRKGAVLSAIAYWIKKTEYLPLASLVEAVNTHKHADKLTVAINNVEQLMG